jgi:hypothetical protein
MAFSAEGESSAFDEAVNFLKRALRYVPSRSAFVFTSL